MINVYSEIKGYTHAEVLKKAKCIYSTTLDILEKADSDDITTHKAALIIAKEIVYNKH